MNSKINALSRKLINSELIPWVGNNTKVLTKEDAVSEIPDDKEFVEKICLWFQQKYPA